MNMHEVALNQALCGFNFVVIFLVILVAYVWILVILHLRCHIENPSIEDTTASLFNSQNTPVLIHISVSASVIVRIGDTLYVLV